jgi:hypothetical protein
VGNGCVWYEAQFVGKVAHAVHTFHQLNPVPPLGAAAVGRKNEGGRMVVLGTGLESAALGLPKLDGTSDRPLQMVDQPELLELPHQRTAFVTPSQLPQRIEVVNARVSMNPPP